MNMRQVIKNMKLVSGGIALLSAAGITYAVSRQLKNRNINNPPFDPKNMVDVKGKILSIEQSQEKKDEARGIYMNIESEGEIIPVYLGPAWYVIHQSHSLKPGDNIQVRGSKTKFLNRESLIAGSVIRGGEELKLRDEDGSPYWNGWRKVKA